MTLAEGLPTLAKQMREDYRQVTLEQLLSHHAGLPGSGESWPKGMTFDDMFKQPGTVREQRLDYTRRMLAEPPIAKPGTRYEYSNAGYVVAAAMIEHALDQSWEDALRERLFEPLGMKSAGFGASGIAAHQDGKIDQPWPHQWTGKQYEPLEPSLRADNPPVCWPGGGVHCSLADWAKFAALHLRGSAADEKLLRKISFAKLHTPMPGSNYACGWGVQKANDGTLTILQHEGSNTLNYSIIEIDIPKQRAILVVTNQGGNETDTTLRAVLKDVRLLAD